MTRMTQKQVADMFKGWCRVAGVPTSSEYSKRTHRPKTPYFHVGGAYGMMKIEFIGKTGGSWDVSGYMGARDMYHWLQNFDPKTQYRQWKAKDARYYKATHSRARGGRCR